MSMVLFLNILKNQIISMINLNCLESAGKNSNLHLVSMRQYFDKIVNPETNRKVSLASRQGRQVLGNYLSAVSYYQSGGSQLGGSQQVKESTQRGFLGSRAKASANVAANVEASKDTKTLGTQKNIKDLTDDDIREILNNYPYAKQWDPKIVTNELKLLQGDADYQKIYSKVWNMMDAFMTIRNTRCRTSARQQNRANTRECFNSYSPRRGNSFTSRGKERKGSFLGNPGQSAVTDYCANLIKNTAEREVDHTDPKTSIEVNSAYSDLAPVENGLGSNTQCSTWCKDIHEESDQAVRELAIKLVSEPDKWKQLKAENTNLWPKVKKIVKQCSRKCPINVLNASCGYILRNQGLANGIPFKDVCAATVNLPMAQRACQISKDLKLIRTCRKPRKKHKTHRNM